MEHPAVIWPAEHAVWRSDKMGKSTLYQSPRVLVGLNAFEPGQTHMLHAHAGMDKVYQVLDGEGVFLLEDRELSMHAGELLVAPEGVPHGVRNTGAGRLLVALLHESELAHTDPDPQFFHRPMRYDIGLPRTVI